MTGGDIRLGPGTLYEAIQRLEEDGLIEEAPASADQPQRRTVSADACRSRRAARGATALHRRSYARARSHRGSSILPRYSPVAGPAARARLSGVVPPPVPVGARVRVPRRAGRAALCASRRRCTALVDTLLDLRVGVAPTHAAADRDRSSLTFRPLASLAQGKRATTGLDPQARWIRCCMTLDTRSVS